MSRAVGGVYLDLTSSLLMILPTKDHQGSCPGHLLRKKPIPCPKMALLTSLPNQSHDTKDPGSLSKLIRCPGKVRREGEKSDAEKMVLVGTLWDADGS